MAHEQRLLSATTTRRSVVVSAVGAAGVVVVLALVLAGQRDEFAAALGAASLFILLLSAALQVVALVARSEAWHTCVTAAGGTVTRRRLYWAASMGNLGSLVNTNLAAAARIAVLRRTAPRESPRVGALVAAEIPIVGVEACLAVLTCFTLVGPLRLPWWVPLAAFVVAAGLVKALCACADCHRRGPGAAAVVLILGANGVAATTAAGVLLTVTGTAGALAYAGWAVLDRLSRSPATAAARRATAPLPVVAIPVERT